MAPTLLPLLEHGLHSSLCAAAGLEHPGESLGCCAGVHGSPGWTQDHVDIRTSESKGVDANDAAAHGNRSVDHVNPAVGEGWNVGVWMSEVQVGSPDSSLQRKQHLCR